MPLAKEALFSLLSVRRGQDILNVNNQKKTHQRELHTSKIIKPCDIQVTRQLGFLLP